MNVVYFNPDEMRADVLACYGHPLVKTPNFDRLAQTGVRFDQCHVQHTVCTPSRCSFMTGWYPHVRGHRTLWHSLRPDEPNTLKYLKQAGYDVWWMGKNDLLATESVADSLTHCATVEGDSRRANPYDLSDPRYMSFLYTPPDGHVHDYYLVEEAARLIRSRKPGDPPFMLYIPISFPHCPYTVPEPWYSMYDPKDLPALRPVRGEGAPDFHEWIRRYRRLTEVDDDHLRKIMAVYLGMVSYVDHLLGMVLDALDKTGLSTDTTVFAFSDHGDWAGDYGLVEKWPSGLDDCLTRIPMIVRSPSCSAGHVVHEPTECLDIVPTTLELAGIEARHTHFARSMVPQLGGLPGDPDRAAFAEGGYDTFEPHCFEGKPEDGVAGNPAGIYCPKGIQQQEHPETVCRSVMVRTATHKLIRRSSGIGELYDMVNDPLELTNIYGHPDHARAQAELERRLLDWYLRTSDVTPVDTDPRGFVEEVRERFARKVE